MKEHFTRRRMIAGGLVVIVVMIWLLWPDSQLVRVQELQRELAEKEKKAAEQAGYSSVEEFVAHCVENEIKRRQTAADTTEEQVSNQLRGLGYIE